ncbi:MAG: hypothetical protein NXI32_13145 [bacterium]|nr:hypothetical protein [bacterium]
MAFFPGFHRKLRTQAMLGCLAAVFALAPLSESLLAAGCHIWPVENPRDADRLDTLVCTEGGTVSRLSQSKRIYVDGGFRYFAINTSSHCHGPNCGRDEPSDSLTANGIQSRIRVSTPNLSRVIVLVPPEAQAFYPASDVLCLAVVADGIFRPPRCS